MNDIRTAPLDSKALRFRLRVLPWRGRAAFVGSCGERVIAVFDAFARQSGCEGTTALRRGVDLVWAAAAGIRIDADELREAERSIRATSPDPDQIYRSPFTTLASDAVQIVQTGLAMVGTADENTSLVGAVDVGIMCQSVIDMYLGLVSLPDFHDASVDRLRSLGRVNFSGAPMLVAELDKQECDLQLLEAARQVGEETIKALRETGFIGISPVTRLML